MNKLILNTSFITLNEYINLERSNRQLAAKSKKTHTLKVSYLAMSFNFKLDHSKIYDVHFEWFKPSNRQDHDNIAFAKKFILDGLVVSKSIKTDSPKQIRNFIDTFTLDKTRYYVSCIVHFNEVV